MQNILTKLTLAPITMAVVVFLGTAAIPAFSVGNMTFSGSVASADGDGCGDGGDSGGDSGGSDSGGSDSGDSGGVGTGNSDGVGGGSGGGGDYVYTPPPAVNVYTPPPAAAPVCSITSSPSTVSVGSGSVISWSSTSATSTSISSIGAVALSGSYGVAPTSTMTYVMTVSGAGGMATCQTTVTVTSVTNTYAPSCTLDASQSSIQQGQSTSLYFNSTNATSATLTSFGTVATSGSQTVSPQSTTNYVLTVTGVGASATCTKTIGVTSAPIYVPPTYTDAPYCSIYANQNNVQQGGNVTLTFTSTNAYTASIDAVGTVQTNGSYTVGNINGTRTFVMTVTGSGGTRTCQTTVYAQNVQPAYPSYYTNYIAPTTTYYQPQPTYVAPQPTYVAPAPVQYSYAPVPRANPVRYVAPTRVSLAKVPYTGAEDYMVPMFAFVLALSAAYMFRSVARA
jgi:hypothetical protein